MALPVEGNKEGAKAAAAIAALPGIVMLMLGWLPLAALPDCLACGALEVKSGALLPAAEALLLLGGHSSSSLSSSPAARLLASSLCAMASASTAAGDSHKTE